MNHPNDLACGCCDGVSRVTPLVIANRPGLSALKYRIGTHATFFESLLARLTTLTSNDLASLPEPPSLKHRRARYASAHPHTLPHPLQKLLTTRQATDPSIAMLDAWSTLADVLTFYQERLANEGYLRTAQDLRSIEELARLVGYRLRPGVASSVYLAFEVDDTAAQTAFGSGSAPAGASSRVSIPAGTATKSTPAPGSRDEPQTFETSQSLDARPDWNVIRPRTSRAQRLTRDTALSLDGLYLAKTGLRLSENDYLAIAYDPVEAPAVYRVREVREDQTKQITHVLFQGDSLSRSALLEALYRIVADFPTGRMPVDQSTLLPSDLIPPQVQLARTALAGILADRIKNVELPNSLSELDFTVQTLVCDHLVHTNDFVVKSGTGSRIIPSPRRITVDFVNRAEELARGLSQLLDLDVVLSATSQTLLESQRKQVKELIGEFRTNDGHVEVLAGSVESENPARVLAQATLSFQQLIFDDDRRLALETVPSSVLVGGVDKPIGLHAIQLLPTSSSVDVTKCRAEITVLRTTSGLPSDLALDADSSMVFEPTDISGVTFAFQPKTGSQPTIDTWKRALSRVLAKDANNRDLLVRLSDTSNKSKPITIAVTVQRTHAEGESHEVEFESQVKTAFGRTGQNIRLSLAIRQLTPVALSTPFAARLTVTPTREPAGTIVPQTLSVIVGDKLVKYGVTTPLPGIFAVMQATDGNAELTNLTTKQFNEVLSQVSFAVNRSGNSASSVIVEVFRSQTLDPDNCVAVASRTIIGSGKVGSTTVFSSESGVRQLLSGIAELQSRVSNVTDSNWKDWFNAEFRPKGAKEASDALYGYGASHGSVLTVVEESKSLCDINKSVDNFINKYVPPRPEAGAPDPFWSRRLREWRDELHDHESSQLLPLIRRRLEAAGYWKAEMFKAFGSDSTFSVVLSRVANELGNIHPPNNANNGLSGLVCLIQGTHEKFKTTAALLTRRAKWLDSSVVELADGITSLLNAPRRTFLEKMASIIARHNIFPGAVPQPNPPTSPKDAIGWWLQRMLKFTRDAHVNLLRPAKSGAFCAACGVPCTAECFRLDCLVGVVLQLLDGHNSPLAQAESLTAANLEASLNLVSGDERVAILRLIRELRRLQQRVQPQSAASVRNQRLFAFSGIGGAISILNQLRGETDLSRRELLIRDVFNLLDATSDTVIQLARSLNETERVFLYDLLRQYVVGTPIPEPKVYVLRSQANLFGWNTRAPFENATDTLLSALKSADAIKDEGKAKTTLKSYFPEDKPADEPMAERTLILDGEFKKTSPQSFVLIRHREEEEPTPFHIESVVTRAVAAYGHKGNATVLGLKDPWWSKPANGDTNETIRTILLTTRAFCDAEALDLASEPADPLLPNTNEIECDGLYPELFSGKPIIISGNGHLSGGNAEAASQQSLLFEIDDVDHHIDHELFGDSFHTTIKLRGVLPVVYTRDSVHIYANVVDATHGETQREVLGSGDGARAFQSMALKRSELSQLPAPSPSGADSTLSVRVNDVLWTKVDDLQKSNTKSEHFVALTDAVQRTSIIFGDGVNGARAPTGIENVRAEYRSGIGRKGNVGAGQINQAVGAPLGVKGVKNPLPALGGADPEPLGLARAHAPLGVLAMDRLVSVQDYVDFAARFAGVGKASASLRQGTVYVTVAQMDTEPLTPDGPLFKNLTRALELYGDPSQRFKLLDREVALLIIVARVCIDPRYEWDEVKLRIRTALLDRYSYERSELGQDVLLSDAVATLQALKGVVYVDVDRFDAVKQKDVSTLAARLRDLQPRPRIQIDRERIDECPETPQNPAPTSQTQPTRIASSTPRPANAEGGTNSTQQQPQRAGASPTCVLAAQLCYLPPDVPDALILEQIR